MPTTEPPSRTKKSQEEDLSPDLKNWSKRQVRQCALKLKIVDDDVAQILFQQDINGPTLLLLDAADLKAKHIIFRKQPGRPCKPYPFNRYHDPHKYTEGDIFDITESGALNYIEPCHEFKAFINTTNETKMIKFVYEVIRFAASCMNSRTNGTIHFGIGDKPQFTHGQILGVVVEDKEAYLNELKSAIDGYFEFKHKQDAQMCINPPRFVGVLNWNDKFSGKYVIEVDILPHYVICGENIYHTFNMDTKKAKKKEKGKEKSETKPSKQFFIRDGSSNRNLLAPTTSAKPMEEYKRFVDRVAKLSQLRKQAEENIKSSNQGSRLTECGCTIVTTGINDEIYFIPVDRRWTARTMHTSMAFLQRSFMKVHQPQYKYLLLFVALVFIVIVYQLMEYLRQEHLLMAGCFSIQQSIIIEMGAEFSGHVRGPVLIDYRGTNKWEYQGKTRGKLKYRYTKSRSD